MTQQKTDSPDGLDVLCYKFRHTPMPTLRSWFKDDEHLHEFLTMFAGLTFKIPPCYEQNRAEMKADVLELLCTYDFATETGRHMEAAEAEEGLLLIKEQWEYNTSQWNLFLKTLRPESKKIADFNRACRRALGE